MGRVKIEFTGDKSQLEAAYRDLAAAHAKLENQVVKLSAASVKGGKDSTKAQGDMAAAVRSGTQELHSQLAGWVSMAGAIASAKAEAEEFYAIQQAAFSESASVGKSQSKLLFNLAGERPEDIQKFLADIADIQKNSQFGDLRQLYEGAASGLAATGGDKAITLDILRATSNLARNSPEDLKDITLGASTIQDTIPGLTPQQAIGFMTTVGGPSYIADPAQQSRYIPAMIKSSLETGTYKSDAEKRESARHLGAMGAATGSVAGDTEGMSTRTDQIDFFVELRDLYTKGIEKTVRGRKVVQKFGPDPGTPEGRLAALWANPEAQKAFIEQTTSEKQFTIAREGMVDPEGITAKKYREFLPRVRFDEADYNDLASVQKDGTKEIRSATAENEAKAAKQRRQLDAANFGAQARQIRDESLAETRKYGAAPYFLKYSSEKAALGIDDTLGADPFESGISALEERRKQIRQPRGLLGGTDKLAPARDVGDLSPAAQQDYRYLGEQIEALRKLQEQQVQLLREQAEATRNQTDMQRETVRQANDRRPGSVDAARAQAGRQAER